MITKPLLTWTFAEDLEEWMNDGDNWSQKWGISKLHQQNLLCLHAKPSQRNRQSILLSRKKNPTESDVQARLTSPLIPSDLGLRCFSIFYSFYFGPGVKIPKTSSLSLLQRQKGCLDFSFTRRLMILSLSFFPSS